MPSVYDLKPRFRRRLLPLAGRLHRLHVTPNQITLGTVVLSAAMGVALYAGRELRWPFLVFPLFLFARMAFNALDGLIAETFGQRTTLGAVLNEVADPLCDVLTYLPFAALHVGRPWLPVSIVVLALLAEIAGLAPLQAGAARRFDGPMGKSDRAAWFGLISALIGLRWASRALLDMLFAIVAGLLVLTVFNRIRHGVRAAAGKRMP